MESEGIGGADVIADIFEMLPCWHGGEPAPCFPDIPVCPIRIRALFMDVPIVGRCDDAAVRMGCTASDCMCLQRIQSDRILRSMRFAESVGKIDRGTFVERCF